MTRPSTVQLPIEASSPNAFGRTDRLIDVMRSPVVLRMVMILDVVIVPVV